MTKLLVLELSLIFQKRECSPENKISQKICLNFIKFGILNMFQLKIPFDKIVSLLVIANLSKSEFSRENKVSPKLLCFTLSWIDFDILNTF